jgi:signal transduction histidine kinase
MTSDRTRPGRAVHLGTDSRTTPSALWDLAIVVAVVWGSFYVIHRLKLADTLAEWNQSHPEWEVDELALVAVVLVAALGVFSWRRWRETHRLLATQKITQARLETAEGKIAMKDEFLGAVSNALRGPLDALLAHAETLANEEGDPEQRDAMAARVLKHGTALSEIIDGLVTRSRAEAGTLRMAHVTVDLNAQVAQVIEGCDSQQLVGMKVIPGPAPLANADPVHVRQIIRSLISNAARYGGNDIQIHTESEAGLTRLLVSDNGPGIPDDQLEAVFDPYYRIAHSKSAQWGLGLGLAVARQLARLMAGDLTYCRRQGLTVFELTLPTAVSVAANPADVASAA